MSTFSAVELLDHGIGVVAVSDGTNVLGVNSDGSINVRVLSGGGGGGNLAAGPTGSAVPADADYEGVNIGGTLTGVTGLALGAITKAPTIAIVDGSGNQITTFGGGTQFADNAASGATPTGTLSMGWDSVNSKVRALKVDASQGLEVALEIGGTVYDARQIRALTSADVVDVADRASRLVGVIYGSQGQQLKQTATNFNLEVELATGATLYDARQIRTLTAADVITAAQGAPGALSTPWFVEVTDGTHTLPMGDSALRSIHVTIDNATLTIAQPVSVTQNTGSPFTPWLTSDIHFPGDVPLSDFLGNPITTEIGANLLGWDPTTNFWRRVQMDSVTFALKVSIAAQSLNPLIVTDSKLPAAVLLSDVLANPTTTEIASDNLGWDATNNVWRRIQVDPGTGTMKVDPGTVTLAQPVSVTQNIGSPFTPWLTSDTHFPGDVPLSDFLGNPITTEIGANLLGWEPISNFWKRVQVDTSQALRVNIAGGKATYSASIIFNPTGGSPLSPMDIATIFGSSTKTIRVTRVEVSLMTTGTAAVDEVQLSIRSTANTKGVGTAIPAVAHDRNDANPTATSIYWTQPPSQGVHLAYVRGAFFNDQSSALPGAATWLWTFGDRAGAKELTFRGATQGLAVVVGAVVTQYAIVSFEWTEE